MNKKIGYSVLSLAAVMLGVAGCGSGDSASDSKQIRMFVSGDTSEAALIRKWRKNTRKKLV